MKVLKIIKLRVLKHQSEMYIISKVKIILGLSQIEIGGEYLFVELLMMLYLS
jgi:hypothetical protein